jgi:hypothetical protein
MLRHIPQRSILSRVKQNNVLLPTSIDTTCPLCRRKVNFSIAWNSVNAVVNYSGSHCPACQKKVRFIQVVNEEDSNPTKTGEIFICPGSDIRQGLPGLDESPELQEGLKKAYSSAINVFNAQEWTATSVLCRRVLEGITKSILPEEDKNKPLGQQLKALPKSMDLNKPILTLAEAIRKGGNLGAHFDLEKEPNEEISSLMIDLLDYLLEYIFILPDRIENLHNKIEQLSTRKS